MRKNSCGFSSLGILIVFISFVLIIVIGLSIFHKHQKYSNIESGISSPSNISNTVKYQGSSVSLPLFSQDRPTAKISFVVPDGWVADKKSSLGFFADDLTYKPGTKFSYSNTASDKDIERFMLSVTDVVPKEYKVYQKSDLGKINGNEATLYYHEFAPGENIGNVHMQGGEKEFMYFIVKGHDAVMTSYYILSGDQDQRSLIDSVIHSISF